MYGPKKLYKCPGLSVATVNVRTQDAIEVLAVCLLATPPPESTRAEAWHPQRRRGLPRALPPSLPPRPWPTRRPPGSAPLGPGGPAPGPKSGGLSMQIHPPVHPSVYLLFSKNPLQVSDCLSCPYLFTVLPIHIHPPVHPPSTRYPRTDASTDGRIAHLRARRLF